MKTKRNTSESGERVAITDEDFLEFLSATGEEQWKILLAHAEKNEKLIQGRKDEESGK